MRKSFLLPAVLTLFLLVPASITWAQTISSQKGLTTAIFQTPNGTIKVYLPDDIRAGDMISGTVTAAPEGNNERQLQRNLAELSRFRVLVNGQLIALNPQGNQTLFTTSAQANSGCNLGVAPAGSAVPVQQLTIPPVPPALQKKTPAQCIIPGHVLEGSPMTVPGPFDGNAANTQCSIGNQPATILAESPRSCTVQFPANANGMQQTQISESGQAACTQNVSAVQMNVTAGKLNLRSGEKTFIKVDITGLRDLPDTAFLSLINMSTGVVNLLPSNTILIPLLPGEAASGNFSRQFDVQSTRTGNFTVNVNLDLPENPPTQPQPIQPTQPQCPKCECSCSAKIIHVGTAGDEVTYRVASETSCTGQFGNPPCVPCGIVDPVTNFWTISYSAADPITVTSGHKGVFFSFKNPTKAPVSLSVKVTVTCSDNSQCSCEDKISTHPPSVPVDEKKCPGCQCECSAKITTVETEGDEWEYAADVKAVCTGDYSDNGKPPCNSCGVNSIDYTWTMADDKTAKIAGAANGKNVKIRTIKPGKFVLKLFVKVTCKDGHFCECSDEIEGVVPDKGCELSWTPIAEPAMTGGIDPLLLKEPRVIRRDDFITLKAVGNDIDQLELKCTKIKDCPDRSSIRYLQLAGMVKFNWEIMKGEGTFTLIGCVPELLMTGGDQVIFNPPYVPFPLKPGSEDSTTETLIKLSVIDNNPSQPGDKTVERFITVFTKRMKARPDEYEISLKQDAAEAEEKKEFKPLTGDCNAVEKWTDASGIGDVRISLPARINDNDKLLAGEWLTLEANDQNETDHLYVICRSSNQCDPIKVFNNDYADKLEWTWTASKGTFTGSGKKTEKGRVVVYEAPADITAETEITITVTVDDEGKRHDDKARSASITLRVYPGGVKLSYPSPDWVPEAGGDPAIVKSYLVYKTVVAGKESWLPAFAHNCRIHFFELTDVSAEKGTCLNAPTGKEAKTCRDLLLRPTDGSELLPLSEPMKAATLKNDCDPFVYLVEARTSLPLREAELKVFPEDYGAYGFIRSYANINRHDAALQKKELPYYTSVPVQKTEVTHPFVDPETKKSRGKTTLYGDNRVNIPMDIDENRIPDKGWVYRVTVGKDGSSVIYSIPDYTDKNTDDSDNEPKGDGVMGDGLSVYEEYRGFKIISPGGPIQHVRTNAKVKDLFIHNEDNLRMDIFDTITGLDLHRVNAELYNGNDHRDINFNFGTGHLNFLQKGLWLIDGTGKPPADLCEPVQKDDAEEIVLMGISCPVKNTQRAKSRIEVEKPAPPNWIRKIVVYKDRILKQAGPLQFDPVEKEKQVVAHELSHGLNVYHHGEREIAPGYAGGDKTCVMRYDHIGGIKNDKIGTDLCTAVNGASEEYGRGNCAAQVRVSGNPAIPPVDRMKKQRVKKK